MFRNFGPKPDKSILEVFMDPETGDMGAMVRVPTAILPAWCSVHIQNGVNTLRRAE
ncbi:hypothetical protein PHLCEN_2v8075 [Hermanssonia centrifuga]|uniref:Uncharacterized protein n=1 Tax=Hermanssonia centrifuga TaxID=98765 RepID=A0A2R6NUQ5_9APHY|nr:hypothetical protein PHLCEN_2v8075 [Hermanssonia centrifuga]